jgi:hypothetical protein
MEYTQQELSLIKELERRYEAWQRASRFNALGWKCLKLRLYSKNPLVRSFAGIVRDLERRYEEHYLIPFKTLRDGEEIQSIYEKSAARCG